ncbi:nuclear transport factor 2 family protein [Pseudoalteromonas sp.]|uniref:nuclear transport factor 2 family protein n=1 Tax=Pseudoalteromonas sp. TaxID=53249 RepID=UPI00356901C3
MQQLLTTAQRLAQLEDKQAILELKHRYLNACDEKQPDQVLACFVSGEVDIDFGHIGQFNRREAFVAVYKELGCHEHIVDMHHAQNPMFLKLGDNHAKAKVSLRFQSINTQDKLHVQLGGYYLDEFEKQSDGQWLISKSAFTINSVSISDFSGEYSKVVYSGNCMPK